MPRVSHGAQAASAPVQVPLLSQGWGCTQLGTLLGELIAQSVLPESCLIDLVSSDPSQLAPALSDAAATRCWVGARLCARLVPGLSCRLTLLCRRTRAHAQPLTSTSSCWMAQCSLVHVRLNSGRLASALVQLRRF